MHSDRAAALEGLLRERIVVLDGAMGTMIQPPRPGRGRLPRGALPGAPGRPEERQRPALPRQAGPDPGHPRGVLRGRGRRRRDQHVQLDLGLALRLPPGPPRREINLEGRGSLAGPLTRPRPGTGGRDSWQGRWGRRRGCRRCRATCRTPGARATTFAELEAGLPRAGLRPGRGRGRPAAARDGVRHPQPEGRPLRHRALLRRPGPAGPGDRLDHVHPRSARTAC